MTFTYDIEHGHNRDKVRLLIGDTSESSMLLSDEELCFLETEFGSATDIYTTALAAIDMALVSLARKAESKTVGPLTLSYASRQKNLETARARIEKLASARVGAPTPYAGGISFADKEIDEADDDVNKGFRIGGMDNPGGAQEDVWTDLHDRGPGD